jgi:hypothetical protein
VSKHNKKKIIDKKEVIKNYLPSQMEKLKRVAIVTGSNKGIGFEIVKALAKDFNGNVYLTCIYWQKSSLVKSLIIIVYLN